MLLKVSMNVTLPIGLRQLWFRLEMSVTTNSSPSPINYLIISVEVLPAQTSNFLIFSICKKGESVSIPTFPDQYRPSTTRWLPLALLNLFHFDSLLLCRHSLTKDALNPITLLSDGLLSISPRLTSHYPYSALASLPRGH